MDTLSLLIRGGYMKICVCFQQNQTFNLIEFENEACVHSQATAQILFNHAQEDFASVYHSSIRL